MCKEFPTERHMWALERGLKRHPVLDVDTPVGNPRIYLENFVVSLDHEADDGDLLNFLRDTWNLGRYQPLLLDAFFEVYPQCAIHYAMIGTPLFRYSRKDVAAYIRGKV